ncbi:MAG: AAA family ATPase [Candidatus Methanomethyliales bacterium]|nr:AAA family ATPase [Candidatus Methanomethylicales archaeon]
MPRVDDIQLNDIEELPLSKMKWFNEATKLVKGGIYLLAGEPGSGKTTLSLQLAMDVAEQDKKVLYLTTEQSPSDLKAVMLRLLGGEIPEEIKENMYIEVLAALEDLRFWRSHLFEEYGPEPYRDTRLIVIDSIQGGGVAPSARKAYEELAKFTRIAKNKGVASILVSHVTKRGDIAGPKDVEHHVDCILQYRKAFRLRPLFIPKNRFGPARLDPFILDMGERGLRPSPHATPKASVVKGISFAALNVAEVQARVQVPKWGERASLKAPYLPKEKLQHIINALCQLPDVDASDLVYQISCYIPKVERIDYRFEYDLAIAVAVLSSYIQHAVPPEYGFCGEVDLRGEIRSNIELIFESGDVERNEDLVQGAKKTLLNPIFLEKMKEIKRMFVPSEIQEDLSSFLSDAGLNVDLVGLSSLTELPPLLWPDLEN